MSVSMERLVITTDKKRKPYLEKFKKYFYDASKEEFGGRTLEHWLKTVVFYSIFYPTLIGFMVLLFALFFLTIDKNLPRYHHGEQYYPLTAQELLLNGPLPPKTDNHLGLILPNPGMSFRPQPDYRSTLIRFVQGRPSSYKKYTNHIQAFLEMYEDKLQEGEVFIDCDNLRDNVRNKKKVCRFKVDWLGDGCTWQRDYGYDDGQPCVLLKLNKVYGWEPWPYGSNDTAPPEIRNRWSPEHISVTCEGEGPLDKENIGEIRFWPEKGFPAIYYPYLNQEGYRSPLVFVKFMRPMNGVVIKVWCKAWARNIQHHREDRLGSIHFELLVD